MGTHSTARDHTHRDALAQTPRRQRRAGARETHRTTPHTHHTDLLLVWNEAARVQSAPSQCCAGRIQAASRSRQSRPIQPTPPAGGATGHPAWEATSGSAPREAPHARRMAPHEHALMPLPPCSPTPSAAQAHMGQHHLHGRITPACQPPRASPRAIVHAVRRSNLAAPARWPHGDADRPGTRQAETPFELAALHEAIRASPHAAHHRNRLLVCALSNTQGRAPPSAACTPRGDTGANQSCCTREWHRVWNH
jgi:hypothetical protein